MLRLTNVCFVAGWLALIMVTPAEAQDPEVSAESGIVDAHWKEVLRPIAHQGMQVSGYPELRVGIVELRGRILITGVDVGTLAAWVTYALNGQIIRYQGYVHYRYADGSAALAAMSAKGQVPGMQQGSLTFIEGTGQFEGIEGTMTLSTSTINPAEGINTAEAIGRYSLPHR
ncbi:MAG: hypothetical protein OET44_05410 [Gammaproteobacteria bacterium]|nr:hypothetical protein [Gammaproteobacteria bacterium]